MKQFINLILPQEALQKTLQFLWDNWPVGDFLESMKPQRVPFVPASLEAQQLPLVASWTRKIVHNTLVVHVAMNWRFLSPQKFGDQCSHMIRFFSAVYSARVSAANVDLTTRRIFLVCHRMGHCIPWPSWSNITMPPCDPSPGRLANEASE